MRGAPEPIRVALVGYGATGRGIAALIAERPGLELVAVADADPRLEGLAVPGSAAMVCPLVEPRTVAADIVVITTTSHLEPFAAVALPWIESSTNVLSICEELGYPWLSHPELARRLDAAARDAGVSILGAGANPGLVMDVLPLVLGASLAAIDTVDVRRTIDLSDYGALVQRFGFGLTPAAFEAAGNLVVGHVGFEQSIAHVAAVIGLELDAIDVSRPAIAHVTAGRREGVHHVLDAGSVAATRQTASGLASGRPRITVTEYFAFTPAVGEIPLGDSWRIEGAGRALVLEAPDGVPSLATTLAMAVNCLPAVLAAVPGLRTMSDVPIRDFAGHASQLNGGLNTQMA